MRTFSWTYFAMTGDVEAFMLYKEIGEDASPEALEPAGLAVAESMPASDAELEG